jgi:hypothetical protein
MSDDQGKPHEEEEAGSGDREPLSIACERVGRFLYDFSLLEQGLDDAIIKLFELKTNPGAILTANIDFSRKVSLVQSIAVLQGEGRPEEWAKDVNRLFKEIRGINDPHRQTLAHSHFEATVDGGVQFKRARARESLKREDPLWPPQKFKEHSQKLQSLTAELYHLVLQLRPDWASTYHIIGLT